MLQNPIVYDMWGVQATFSALEASEVKFPALRGFVLPTHFPSGWWVGGGCGLKVNISGESKLICPFTITIVIIIKIIWTSLLVSSSDCYLDLFLILHLSNSTKTKQNTEMAILSMIVIIIAIMIMSTILILAIINIGGSELDSKPTVPMPWTPPEGLTYPQLNRNTPLVIIMMMINQNWPVQNWKCPEMWWNTQYINGRLYQNHPHLDHIITFF